MKNKKVMYFLVPLVIIVWGAIILRLIAYYKGDAEVQEPLNIISTIKDKSNVPDTFSLILNYRDPFLSDVWVSDEEVIVPEGIQTIPIANQDVVPQKKITESIPWPKLVYGGIIENRKNSRTIIIMSVDGKERLMCSGDEYANVKVAKIYWDSVKVIFNKQYKTIKK